MTIIDKTPRPDPVPTLREQFWLNVACAHVAGIGLGMGFVAMVWRVFGG